MADENTPAFTEAQTTELNRIINGVAGNLKKQFETHIGKALEGSKTDLSKLLDEKLQTLRPAPEEGEGAGKGGKGGKSQSLEFQTLQKQVNDAADAIRVANERAARAESRRRDTELRRWLDTSLSKGGVADPFMRDLAISHFQSNARVAWSGEDDEASIVWNGNDGLTVSGDEGLSSWFKTEEAKRFLPPTGKGGSGSRPGQRPPEGKKELTFSDVGQWVAGLGTGQGTRLGE